MWVNTQVFDGAQWDEADAAGAQGTIQNLFATLNPDGADGRISENPLSEFDAHPN